MNADEESRMRSRIAEAESLKEAMRNNEVDAIVNDERFLVLRILELGEQHRQLLEDLPDVIFRLDAGKRVVFVSPAVTLYTKLEPAEIRGRTIDAFSIPEPIREKFQSLAGAAMRDGVEREFVSPVDTRQGKRHLLVRLFPDSPVEGAGEGLLGIISDVSRIQKAERKLRKSEARLRTAIEGADLGTFEYDTESGGFNYWNRRMFELHGLAADAGPPPGDALERVHPGDVEAFRRTLHDAVDEAPSRIVYRVLDTDGEPRWLSLAARRVNGHRSPRPLVVGVVHDITAQREAEESLRSAKESADAASRHKSDFIASLSHEVRTPLTNIMAFSDILDRSATPQLLEEGLESIRENGKLLMSIINDVLDLSKLEAGMTRIDRKEVELRELVDQMASLIKPRVRQKELRFVIEVDDSAPATLVTDSERLKQILLNLLANAIKFTDEGEVRLAVRDLADDQVLCFEVVDSGPGISEEFREKLFRPFEQECSSTSRQGSGLGLAICRRLAEALGGELELAETSPTGSIFTLRLPVGKTSADS